MSDSQVVIGKGMKDLDSCLDLFCWCSSRPRPLLLSGMLKSPNRGNPILGLRYLRFLVLEHNL